MLAIALFAVICWLALQMPADLFEATRTNPIRTLVWLVFLVLAVLWYVTGHPLIPSRVG